MSKSRRNLSLDADVEAILDDISRGQSTASSYLEDLVRDAERDWRTALSHLRAAGWQDPELRAACDVLNGYLLGYEPGQPASWIGLELADAERLNATASVKHDIAPTRWTEVVGRVHVSEAEARCLLLVVREFWRMNPRLDRALGIE
jgi:hypothetical protein